jgi:hypothetical protein
MIPTYPLLFAMTKVHIVPYKRRLRIMHYLLSIATSRNIMPQEHLISGKKEKLNGLDKIIQLRTSTHTLFHFVDSVYILRICVFLSNLNLSDSSNSYKYIFISIAMTLRKAQLADNFTYI